MLNPMSRRHLQGLVIVIVTLFIFWNIRTRIVEATIALPSQNSNRSILDGSFLFSIALLALLLVFINRRKTFRVAMGSFLFLSSYICWFSIGAWSEYNISSYEQRFIAIILMGIALWVLVSKSSKEKRKYFSGIVRREVIQKQKGKCASGNSCLLEWISTTETVTDLITRLPTAKYCALHAIGESMYKSNQYLGRNLSGEVFRYALNLRIFALSGINLRLGNHMVDNYLIDKHDNRTASIALPRIRSPQKR